MKTTITLMLAALLAACHQPIQTTQPTATPTVTKQPAAAPEPVVVASVPALPTTTLAPVEVHYYLASPVSIETADGLTGIPAGTRIEPLHDNVYLVAETQMALRSNQVTSDTTLVQRVRAQEAASQASIRQLATPMPPAIVVQPVPVAQQPTASQPSRLSSSGLGAKVTPKPESRYRRPGQVY